MARPRSPTHRRTSRATYLAVSRSGHQLDRQPPHVPRAATRNPTAPQINDQRRLMTPRCTPVSAGISGPGVFGPRLLWATRIEGQTTAVDWPSLRACCQQRGRLECHHGHDIDLCVISCGLGDGCGAWQQHEDHDVIAYTQNTSGFHQVTNSQMAVAERSW